MLTLISTYPYHECHKTKYLAYITPTLKFEQLHLEPLYILISKVVNNVHFHVQFVCFTLKKVYNRQICRIAMELLPSEKKTAYPSSDIF